MEQRKPPDRPLFLAPDIPAPQPPVEEDTKVTPPVILTIGQAQEIVFFPGPPVRDREEAKDVAAALIFRATQQRRELGLLQRQLKTRTGIRQARISSLESGQHMPMLDTYVHYLASVGGRLAIVFDSPPNDDDNQCV